MDTHDHIGIGTADNNDFILHMILMMIDVRQRKCSCPPILHGGALYRHVDCCNAA